MVTENLKTGYIYLINTSINKQNLNKNIKNFDRDTKAIFSN